MRETGAPECEGAINQYSHDINLAKKYSKYYKKKIDYKEGNTPLLISAKENSFELVKFLVEQGKEKNWC